MNNALTYQVEDYLQALPEMQRLYQAHYEEVGVLHDKFTLDPDYGRYQQIHAANGFHLVTVRAQGELAGYHLSFIMMHLHYRNEKIAVDDLFFLSKEHRSGFTGVRLFKEAERTLKARGVQAFINKAKRHVKSGDEEEYGVGKLLEALGFQEFERSYIKWIGD